MKVALLTEIISPYRIPVFNALAKLPQIDLKVLFASETSRIRNWTIPKADIQFDYEVLPGWEVAIVSPHSSLFFNPEIVKSLRQNRFDVVICGGYHQPTYWLALLYSRLAHTRTILWSESNRYDHRVSYRLKSIFKRTLIRGFDQYIVPGQSQRDYLLDFGILPTDIWTAPNAVDVDHFSQKSSHYRASKDEIKQRLGISGPIVLYVGRLLDAKGVADLLAAFEKIHSENDATLLIVGTGPDEERYRNWAEQRGIPVHFTGFVQQDELPMYYAIADLFVFPTYSDPWGLVVNEAMSCGLPIIVSSVAGATKDLIQHGWNGYIIDPGNIEMMAQHIHALLNAPEMRTQMGERSQVSILNYTPDKCAEGFAKAILGQR
jgi:glycosyltransferase involved in cell wall biosynthesis